MTIAVGETVEYQCTLQVANPGPFAGRIQLNVFDTDYRQLVLSVHGLGVSQGTAHAKGNP